MNPRKQRDFLTRQATEVGALAASVESHQLMGPQMNARAANLKAAAELISDRGIDARTIVYFYGKPVYGSEAIDAHFVAAFLEPFLEAVKTQYSARIHGHVGERGPRRNEDEAKLMLAGTPRGSFGLELVAPQVENDLFAEGTLSDALKDITLTIGATSESDDAYLARLDEMPDRVFVKIRQIFKVLRDGEAGLRVLTGETEVTVEPNQIESAFQRLANSTERERETEMRGVFRGITLESWRFDFRTEDQIIRGRIADDVSEETAADMVQYINRECVAKLALKTVTTPSGVLRHRYQLLALAD